MIRKTTFTEKVNGKIKAFSDCRLTEKPLSFKKNIFKTHMNNFHYDSSNYVKNKTRGHL